MSQKKKAGKKIASKQVGSVPMLFVAAVLSGVLCNATFGVINQADPGCSHLVTLLQQVFTLTLTWRKGEHIWKTPQSVKGKAIGKRGIRIPISWHLAVVLCQIGGCFLGNLALDLNLPLPLFFLVKCGNLVASMVVGALFLKRTYSYDQVLSVVLVTIGLCYSTIHANGSMTSLDLNSLSIFFGAFSVFLALISTSFLGAVQEIIFSRYREHFDEVTFLGTLLFIPLYLTLNYTSIVVHLTLWWKGGWLKVVVPLVVNACCSHICRLTMTQLTGVSSQGALTSMYAATTYRFSAIVVSSWASEKVGYGLWMGVGLVFVGTIISFSSEGNATKPVTLKDKNMRVRDKLTTLTPHADQLPNRSLAKAANTKLTQHRPNIDTVTSRQRNKQSVTNSPNRHKIPRRASSSRIQLDMAAWEDFDLAVSESMSPASMNMRRSSSLHADLDLLQSIRYSV